VPVSAAEGEGVVPHILWLFWEESNRAATVISSVEDERYSFVRLCLINRIVLKEMFYQSTEAEFC